MQKKTVVLINPSNPEPPPNYFGPPYGISLIGATLLEDKRAVKAYDFDLDPLETMLSSIEGIIKKDQPEYIGICIQSCSRGAVYRLIRQIKKIDRNVIIILGGPFASLKYELLLRNFPVDYAVIGDGERTLIELLNCIDNKKDPKDVQGIAFLLKGRLYVTSSRRKEIRLDSLPYPAFHLFKDFDRKVNAAGEKKEAVVDFILNRRCTTVKNSLLMLSSRGCIYNCNFCPMSGISLDKIRFHSPRYFVDMVEYFYKKYGISNYTFGDNTFTLVRERAVEICDEIVRRRLEIKWSCMTRSDYVDSALLKKMFRAGCFEISYGVESGSSKIQKRIGKNLDLEKTKEAFSLTKAAGMRSVLMLMVGNTGESLKTIKETLAYIKRLDPDNILVKILKVYPGIRIHDIFEKKGLLKKDYYLSYEHTPPMFTVTHCEATLKKFAEMIQPRITYIQVTNACNNNCAGCLRDRKKKDKDTHEIKKELLLASTRGEHVALFGGEPFLRKDIFEILSYGDKLDIHHFYIYSNARVFIYKKLAQAVNKSTLRKIIIPFFGFSALHDKITHAQGAFFQSLEGAKNIKSFAPRIKIEAVIFVLDSNYKALAALTKYLCNCGIDEFRFVFSKDSQNLVEIKSIYLPTMSLAVAQLRKVSKFLKNANKPLQLEGMPPCLLGSLKDELIERRYLFNEVIDPDKRIINCREARQAKKEKFSFCAKCGENELCEGVWRAYSRKYGYSEFKSL